MPLEDWRDCLASAFSEELATYRENAATEEENSSQKTVFTPQRLIVTIDRRHRAGKQVTLISGFVGDGKDLEGLCKALKTQCGAGGSVKDGEILIQGDVRDKVVAILSGMGHKTKRGN